MTRAQSSSRLALRSAAPSIVLVAGMLVIIATAVLGSRPLSRSCGSQFWAIGRTMAPGNRPFFGPSTVRCLELAEGRWPLTWALFVLGGGLVGGAIVALRRRRPDADLFWNSLVVSLIFRGLPYLAVAGFAYAWIDHHLSLNFLGP